MNQNLRPCPGCGVLLPETAGSTHRYIGASPECWSAFGEVSGKEYGDFRYARVHGLTVDAYCAQHPGKPSPQAVRSVAVHLVGLFLLMERDLRPEELYAVHKRTSSLAKEGRKDVFWLDPPRSSASRRFCTSSARRDRTSTPNGCASGRGRCGKHGPRTTRPCAAGQSSNHARRAYGGAPSLRSCGEASEPGVAYYGLAGPRSLNYSYAEKSSFAPACARGSS